jgi:hypothetical protein
MTRLNKLIFKRCIALAALALLAACSPKADFQKFAPEIGRFEALYPSKPEYKTATQNFGGTAITLHSYAVVFDDVVYGINYFEIPESINKEMRQARFEDVMNGGRDGMLAQNRWTLKEDRGDQTDISPARTSYGKRFIAALPSGKQTATVRIFWLENRMYQIMVIVPDKKSYNQEIYPTRFLESFRIKA